MTAARAASRLTDTRLTQVFDVEDSWEHAYIVLEWPVGDTLADLVSDGPMDALSGARVVAEAAAALSGAHAAGLAHLCLRPESVRWTTGGGVKVTGLGIDAALSGTMSDDPELTDTRGLGQLLYAALTGLWPDADDDGDLPAAPTQDGLPRRPRQVLAGVPTFLDDVACRALALPGRDGQPAFSAPSQLAAALAAVIPPVQVPPAATVIRDRRDLDRQSQYARQDRRGAPPARQGAAASRPSQGRATDRTDPAYRGRQEEQRSQGRHVGRMAAIAVVAVVAVAGVSAAAIQLLHKSPAAASPGGKSSSSASPSGSVAVITPQSASGFDALNPTGDAGNENSGQASNVLTGSPQGWSTQFYDTAEFGQLKKGTGFILNLGSPVQVSSVTVQFGSEPGANVQIKLGDSNTRSAANLYSMTTVARANDVSGQHTFTIGPKTSGQYLVIWFTKLPPMAKKPGRFMAQIFSVVIRGGS